MSYISVLNQVSSFEPEHSHIQVGAYQMSYHSDRFSARISKGLEDIIGPEKAADFVLHASAKMLSKILNETFAPDPSWAAMNPQQKFENIFYLFQALGNATLVMEEFSEHKIRISTTNSYLAEAYMDNMKTWNWPLRQKPFCHELAGYLLACAAYATGRTLDQVSIRETACLTTGDDCCKFEMELN